MSTPAGVLAADHHVHSYLSEGAQSTIVENLTAARRRGLARVCFVEHVRAGTTWTPVFVRAVRLSAGLARGELEVFAGVETTMLDWQGRLDLPANLATVDRVLIADHDYPSPTGPVSARGVRLDLEAGRLTPVEVVETLAGAMVAALRRVPRAQLAHPFSLLPRVGLSEDSVSDDQLRALASAAQAASALVECNEKWRCPGPRVLAAFAAAGVEIVPGTSSYRAKDVGVYDWVARTLA